MPASIGSLVSQLFYKEKLKNGVIKNTSQFYDPKNIIRWINVEGEHKLEKTSSYNKAQVQKKNACDQKWKNAASRILIGSK